jgi:mannose-6-phosphate isomerase
LKRNLHGKFNPAAVMVQFMKLMKHMVEKPWGRIDVPAIFHAPPGTRVGEIWYDDGAEKPLPLLVKWLFTSESLSIQVHPNDDQAAARGLTSGKEECWYIVDALPGATLGLGTKQPVSPQQLRAAALDGSIEELMDWKPVCAGDYFFVPAGTVHAIGAGITLVEVQQYADITYRLYDYGRLDKGRRRELHLDDGIAVSLAKPYTDARSGNEKHGGCLAESPHFTLWLVNSSDMLRQLPDDRMRWIVPLSGTVRAGNDVGSVGECLTAGIGEAIDADAGAQFLFAY